MKGSGDEYIEIDLVDFLLINSLIDIENHQATQAKSQKPEELKMEEVVITSAKKDLEMVEEIPKEDTDEEGLSSINMDVSSADEDTDEEEHLAAEEQPDGRNLLKRDEEERDRTVPDYIAPNSEASSDDIGKYEHVPGEAVPTVQQLMEGKVVAAALTHYTLQHPSTIITRHAFQTTLWPEAAQSIAQETISKRWVSSFLNIARDLGLLPSVQQTRQPPVSRVYSLAAEEQPDGRNLLKGYEEERNRTAPNSEASSGEPVPGEAAESTVEQMEFTAVGRGRPGDDEDSATKQIGGDFKAKKILAFFDSIHDFRGTKSTVHTDKDLWNAIHKRMEVENTDVLSPLLGPDIFKKLRVHTQKKTGFETDVFNILFNKFKLSKDEKLNTERFHFFVKKNNGVFDKIKNLYEYRGSSTETEVVVKKENVKGMLTALFEEQNIKHYVQDLKVNNFSIITDGTGITQIYPLIQLWDPQSTDVKKVENTIKDLNVNGAENLFMNSCSKSTNVEDPRTTVGEKKSFSVKQQEKESTNLIITECNGTKPGDEKFTKENVKSTEIRHLSKEIKKVWKNNNKDKNDKLDEILVLLDKKRTGDWGQATWVYNTNNEQPDDQNDQDDQDDEKKTIFMSADRLASLYSILLGNPTIFGGVNIGIGDGKKAGDVFGIYIPEQRKEQMKTKNEDIETTNEKNELGKNIDTLLKKVEEDLFLIKTDPTIYTVAKLRNIRKILLFDPNKIKEFIVDPTDNESNSSSIYQEYREFKLPILYSAIDDGKNIKLFYNKLGKEYTLGELMLMKYNKEMKVYSEWRTDNDNFSDQSESDSEEQKPRVLDDDNYSDISESDSDSDEQVPQKQINASPPRIQPKRGAKTKTLERNSTKDTESKERLGKKKKQRADNAKRKKAKALKKKRDKNEIKELTELFSKMKVSDDKE
tara:strand:+ start:5911 stop:8685 length:2775 start_codon:yes stop_codon:yes gene_type:complete